VKERKGGVVGLGRIGRFRSLLGPDTSQAVFGGGSQYHLEKFSHVAGGREEHRAIGSGLFLVCLHCLGVGEKKVRESPRLLRGGQGEPMDAS